MTKDAKQFLQFVGAILGLGLVGGMVINQPWARGLELPLGILWIVVFLGAVGFIFQGKDGAKDLIKSTALMWSAALVISGLILWLVVAGAGHNL